MAGADWEKVLIDETGRRYDYLSFNGINLWIKKYWVYIDNSSDIFEPDDGSLSFSIYAGDLRINHNPIFVARDDEIDGVYLFVRYFDAIEKKHFRVFGIGCYAYTDDGEYKGISDEIVSRYQGWLLENVQCNELPDNLNRILSEMVTKESKGTVYGT